MLKLLPLPILGFRSIFVALALPASCAVYSVFWVGASNPRRHSISNLWGVNMPSSTPVRKFPCELPVLSQSS